MEEGEQRKNFKKSVRGRGKDERKNGLKNEKKQRKRKKIIKKIKGPILDLNPGFPA